jgi:subfamily B ATP-binding cassette protein HlyB/CyaB
VIIDKVIVHQTHSTLIVLGVALVMFMLFTSRHELAAPVPGAAHRQPHRRRARQPGLPHLLRLPLPYFEQRPTGTLVARLHGVETMREFVSGAAVTLMLDLPFLLIFLAVMFCLQLAALADRRRRCSALIALISLLVAPLFRDRLNRSSCSARATSLPHRVPGGMATVKSLQMEPDIGQSATATLPRPVPRPASPPAGGQHLQRRRQRPRTGDDARHPDRRRLLVMQNDGFTVGMLVAFQMFASRMSQPLLRLVGLWQEFQQASIAVKRLGDILDMPRRAAHAHPAARAAAAPGARHRQAGLPLLRAAPLALPQPRPRLQARPADRADGPLGLRQEHAGQAAAGLLPAAGRPDRASTAATSGIWPPTNCATFGVVPQETVLFSGTLYDNLVMAHPHASFEDVIAACKAAEIHEVIEPCRRATRPRSASAAPGCRAASASASPLPGRCSSGRRS